TTCSESHATTACVLGNALPGYCDRLSGVGAVGHIGIMPVGYVAPPVMTVKNCDCTPSASTLVTTSMGVPSAATAVWPEVSCDSSRVWYTTSRSVVVLASNFCVSVTRTAASGSQK